MNHPHVNDIFYLRTVAASRYTIFNNLLSHAPEDKMVTSSSNITMTAQRSPRHLVKAEYLHKQTSAMARIIVDEVSL